MAQIDHQTCLLIATKKKFCQYSTQLNQFPPAMQIYGPHRRGVFFTIGSHTLHMGKVESLQNFYCTYKVSPLSHKIKVIDMLSSSVPRSRQSL